MTTNSGPDARRSDRTVLLGPGAESFDGDRGYLPVVVRVTGTDLTWYRNSLDAAVELVLAAVERRSPAAVSLRGRDRLARRHSDVALVRGERRLRWAAERAGVPFSVEP